MDERIGRPLEEVLKQVGDKKVTIIKNSKPKIKTDSQLVVAVRESEGEITLIVGDFLLEV